MRGDNHEPGSVRGDALYESRVFLLLPVEEVVQVIHERGLVQNALLCQGMQIVRVGESLDEFQLELEADAVRCLGLVNRHLRHPCLGARSKRWYLEILLWLTLRSQSHLVASSRSDPKRKVTRPIVCHPPVFKLSHLRSSTMSSGEENSGWNLTESGI